MFQIHQINEIKFELKEEDISSKDIQVNYTLKLQYQEKISSICLLMLISYTVDNKVELLRGGSAIVASVPDWESIRNDENAVKNSGNIQELVSYATIFTSGQVFRFCTENGLKLPTVPYVEPAKLIELMPVQMVEPSKKQ
ncbi:MAG: hypothetical protein MJZ66_10235 [Bacteroidales bacterium]|nr:hypothetical protein [Bacteroidales bacterium]